MNASLSERVRERLASQTAEIEAMTANELKQLAANLRTDVGAAQSSIQSAICAATQSTTASMASLRMLARWWWVALLVTWVTIGGLSVWFSQAPKTAGMDLYQTFEFQGRKYLLLPEGTQGVTCRSGERQMPCALLPTGE